MNVMNKKIEANDKRFSFSIFSISIYCAPQWVCKNKKKMQCNKWKDRKCKGNSFFLRLLNLVLYAQLTHFGRNSLIFHTKFSRNILNFNWYWIDILALFVLSSVKIVVYCGENLLQVFSLRKNDFFKYVLGWVILASKLSQIPEKKIIEILILFGIFQWNFINS